jgi:hypothetical protein
MSPRRGGSPSNACATTNVLCEQAEKSRAVTPPQSATGRMRVRRREEPATTPLMVERAWQFDEIGHTLYVAAPSTTRDIKQKVIRQPVAILTNGGCP